MKKIPFIIQLILLSALWSGCVKDSFRALLPEEGTARLHFRVKIPSTGSSSLSRAVQEEGLNQVSLLVLENTGNGFQYQYAVSGYSIQESTTADYEFLARILLSANPLRIYLVANVSGATDPLTLGMSEEEVKEALTEDFTASGFSGFLPMSGVLDFPDGISGDATAPVTSLIRSVARVDVINSAGNFTLTSVRVYRAMDLLQVIPDRTTDHTVTAVSVPAGALPQIDTVPVEAEDNSVQASVYIPESDITPSSDRLLGSTAVVIGGIYEGSGVTTYYRLDFVPDDDRQDLFGQVLRNHLYRFHITEVQVPGWSTDDEAAVNPSSQIQAEIVVWNEEDLYMVFDGIDHFGVSRRTVRLGYSAGASAEVSVDTSLESYRAYWGGEADGTLDSLAGSITLGEEFEDPEAIVRAAISSDGARIRFTALENYDPDRAGPLYLVVVAGRLRIVLTVTQGTASYQDWLSIANATVQIGTFGDYRLGPFNSIFSAGERALGVVNMLLQGTNFGLGQKVDVDGVIISGVNTQYTMPPTAYQNSQVLYLTYLTNPQQSDVDRILQWLEEQQNRVLIVQFDNSATNSNMMQTLGLNFVAGTTIAAYTFTADQAPDFIQDGVFGTVEQNFSYNCRDDTYGTLVPDNARAAGFTPVLLSQGGTPGNYVLAVNPSRRIIVCGDCDIWSNVNAGSGGYLLNLTAASSIIDPANPAHVIIGNLWAWITEIAWTVGA